MEDKVEISKKDLFEILTGLKMANEAMTQIPRSEGNYYLLVEDLSKINFYNLRKKLENATDTNYETLAHELGEEDKIATFNRFNRR